MRDIKNYSESNDLNYYFNSKNIANQSLVSETYDLLEANPDLIYLKSKGYFSLGTLDFFNILEWHNNFLKKNIERPFDFIKSLENLPIEDIEKHVLIALILKWHGSLPVNNFNVQYNSILKLLEKEYNLSKNFFKGVEQDILSFKAAKKQDLLAHQIEKLEKYADIVKINSFLETVDKLIRTSDQSDKLLNPKNEIKINLTKRYSREASKEIIDKKSKIELKESSTISLSLAFLIGSSLVLATYTATIKLSDYKFDKEKNELFKEVLRKEKMIDSLNEINMNLKDSIKVIKSKN